MSKIRVEAEPITVSIFDQVRRKGGWYIKQAEFTMPKIPKKGETVAVGEKYTGQLTQPVKVRGNPIDQHGASNHLKLTRFDNYRVFVPVILNFAPSQAEELTEDKPALTVPTIGCM